MNNFHGCTDGDIEGRSEDNWIEENKPDQRSRHFYLVTIESERDWQTLHWLEDHGYAGSILEHAELEYENEETGQYVLSLDEPSAWGVSDCVEDDPDSFLACCGSETLSAALLGLLEEIV
jgi:hypothetical protein